jgi:hypothetical protein
MKKINLILFLFFVSAFGLAQQNKFSCGLVGGYDSYSLKAKNSFGFTHEFNPKLAFSIGLQFQYNFNEKLFSKSGLLYSVKGYEVDYNFNFIATDPIYLDPAIPKSGKFDVKTIALPLSLGYYFKNSEKVKVSSAIGVFSEYVINTNTETTSQTDKVTNSTKLPYPMSTLLFSSQLNLGIEYHFTKKLYLGATPYFRYAFNKVKDLQMEFNSVSIGGYISLNYKFIKKPIEE